MSGRWTSTDPADQFQNITGYGYMANNPLQYTDPDGRVIPLIVAAGAAVIGGGLNLWSNWGKVKNWKQGLAYFTSGAVGGAISVFNPALGGTIIGGISNGLAAKSRGKSFWSGAWKGAIVGGLGGAFGFYAPTAAIAGLHFLLVHKLNNHHVNREL